MIADKAWEGGRVSGQDWLFGLVMLLGLVGVLLPVLPGLLLIWLAAAAWATLGAGWVPWAVFAVMTLVLAVGTIAKYVIPGRSLRGAGAPTATMVFGLVGAVVGFFVLPVVGLIVGFVLGVWLAETARLGNAGLAWSSTWATIKAIGLGMLIELAAGVLAVGIWFAAVTLQ
jgi:uncharacterized protein YqgC (DUF456 family)